MNCSIQRWMLLSALGGSGSIQEIAETVIQQMQLPDDITQPPHKGGPGYMSLNIDSHGLAHDSRTEE